jgi:Mn2+/Fe2+ NRAMP family transporter
MVATEKESHRQGLVGRTASRVLSALGPGLVTGAVDDDPSGIATYSQAGAQFGFALTWTLFLTLPFMAAIQTRGSACSSRISSLSSSW